MRRFLSIVIVVGVSVSAAFVSDIDGERTEHVLSFKTHNTLEIDVSTRHPLPQKRISRRDGVAELNRRGNCLGCGSSRRKSTLVKAPRQQHGTYQPIPHTDSELRPLTAATFGRSESRPLPRGREDARSPGSSKPQQQSKPSISKSQKSTTISKLPVKGLGLGLQQRVPVNQAASRPSSSMPASPHRWNLLEVPRLASLKSFANKKLPSFRGAGPRREPDGRSISFREDGSHGELNLLDTRVPRLGSEPRLGGLGLLVSPERDVAKWNSFKSLSPTKPIKDPAPQARLDSSALSDSDEYLGDPRKTASF